MKTERRIILVLAIGLVFCFPFAGFSQITTDGSLGQATSFNGPDFRIDAEFGVQAGGNLFHSFGLFNIASEQSATFTGPNSVANIIGRITGGAASSIDGALRSEIPGANLYLFNPAGFFFGPGARLDVSGSFHAGTADYLNMGADERYPAVPGPGQVLSVAAPAAFGFIDETVAAVTLENSFLAVPDGRTLGMVGDIQMTGGNLRAPSGRIDVSGTALSLSGGAILSTSASGAGNSGDITVSTSDTVFITGVPGQGGEIGLSGLFTTAVNGNAGDITITTEELTLSGWGTLRADTYGPGNAGAIELDVGTLTVGEGARVSSGTWGAGTAGTIEVNAEESANISGGTHLNGLFYASGVAASSTGESGNAGDINVETPELDLGAGAVIDASSEGTGAGGTIQIAANRFDQSPNSRVAASSRSGTQGSVEIAPEQEEIEDVLDEVVSEPAEPASEPDMDDTVLEEADFGDDMAEVFEEQRPEEAGGVNEVEDADKGHEIEDDIDDAGEKEIDDDKPGEAVQDLSGAVHEGKKAGDWFALLATRCGNGASVSRLKFKDKYSAPVAFKGVLSHIDDYPLRQKVDPGDPHFRAGDYASAIRVWEQMPLRPAMAAKMARAFGRLGFYVRAAGIMEPFSVEILSEPDSPEKVAFLCTLGNLYLAVGRFSDAFPFLKEANAAAERMKDPCLKAAVLNEIGNALAVSGREHDAEETYGKALAAARSGECTSGQYIRTLVNMAMLPNREKANDRLGAALSLAGDLPVSHERARDLLAIGITGIRIGADTIAHNALTATLDGMELYPGLRHYIYGYLGGIYERNGRLDDAIRLTREALFHSGLFYPESRYLWEWQMARLLQSTGDGDSAELYFQKAFETLTPIRNKLYSNFKVTGALFGWEIKPVYLGLADILLKRGKIRDALVTMEILKHVELREFFLDECVTRQEEGDGMVRMPAGAVTLYPIIFPDRIAMILMFKTGLKTVEYPVDSTTVRKTTLKFRRQLQDRSSNRFLRTGKTLHDWIIEPITPLLEASGIDTLIIAPDGVLRLIPFSALFDGKKFLVETYAIGTIPGLSLVSRQKRAQTGGLVGGISESVQNFDPLPSVTAELAEIRKIIDTDIVLQDSDYTTANLARELKARELSTIHIATHGIFGGSPKETFLLMYDGRLDMNGLESMISSSPSEVDLLVLSACQTALGNERAAMGMAGTAVKAGVKTAMATLWSVNDVSTSMVMTEFYNRIREEGGTKAKALQEAQKKLIATDNYWKPVYWAPFLLIGNWR